MKYILEVYLKDNQMLIIHTFNRSYIIYILFKNLKKEKTTINPVDNVEK